MPASLEIATRSESSSCASLTEIKLASTGSVGATIAPNASATGQSNPTRKCASRVIAPTVSSMAGNASFSPVCQQLFCSG